MKGGKTMSKLTVNSKSPFERIKHVTEKGDEFWKARDLLVVLEYSELKTFEPVIQKAALSCSNGGENPADHFVEITELVEIGSGAKRARKDYLLSRYACYLIIQNADPSKPMVALGQAYFAIQTRKQEIFEQSTEDDKRLMLREELKKHNQYLASAAFNAGVETSLDFAIFQNHGYKGLYGGLEMKELHSRRKLGKSQKILDHMGSTELAANLFRATQTEEKLRRDNTHGKEEANRTHYLVGQKVRETIKDLGGTMPEKLPVHESIKKLERKARKQLKSSEDD
jgi:DNA-damage-inducible protein D